VETDQSPDGGMSTYVLYNCRPLEVMYSQGQKDSKESAAKRCTTLLEDASSSSLIP
jgi:hypothetical protein